MTRSRRPAHRNSVRASLTLLLTLPLTLVLASASACTAPSQFAAVRPVDNAGYRSGTSLSNPYELPDKTLTDTTGRPYNLVSSPTKPVVLLFFGYVHCPDVCRAVLSDVAMTLQRSDQAVRDQIQVIFVTTDPARDTPAEIAAYLERFDPSFVGLTGEPRLIKKIARRVGVDISGTKTLPSGGYDVGHSAQVIGFDARRTGVVLWTPNTSIGDLEHDYALLVERSR